MRGQPSRALAALDEFSRTEDFLISVGPQKAGILRDLIEMEQPRVLVELGGYLGYSAILFADQLRRCSNNPSSTAREDQTPRVWSIEADPVFAGFIMSLADLAGLNDIIRVVPGTAEESLRSLQRAGELSHVDFLFLDHSEDLYSADLKVCEEIGILGPGSLIVADNVVRPGAPDYRNFVRNHPKLDSRGIPCLIVPGDIEVSFPPDSAVYSKTEKWVG